MELEKIEATTDYAEIYKAMTQYFAGMEGDIPLKDFLSDLVNDVWNKNILALMLCATHDLKLMPPAESQEQAEQRFVEWVNEVIKRNRLLLQEMIDSCIRETGKAPKQTIN